MSHPIPAPRRPQDLRSNSPYRPLPASGPTCAFCTHRTCRAYRAQHLPRLGGHRTEFAREHRQAARLQAHHPRSIIWFGEATQSFWVASASGLVEAETIDAVLTYLWTHAQRVIPRR